MCLRPAELRDQLADVGGLLERGNPAVPERKDMDPPEVHEPAAPFRTFTARTEDDHLIAGHQEVLGLEILDIQRTHQKAEELADRWNSVA